MINDIRRRAPFYLSDWTDAWDYRVVPATVYMYFAKYVCVNAVITIKTAHTRHLNVASAHATLYCIELDNV